jgi:hypothetical protein
VPDAFAAVPTWAVDLGIVAAIISGVVGAIYAVGRLSGSTMKWMWTGFESAVKRATDDIRDDVSELKHLTKHHLGPNGTTTPMHKRMKRLEEVHGIKDEADGDGA